mmetsp:Transcript_7401/g.13165  ORF Transcript_7401/g.13165 Transcript_7401/m.13165 type:complete len:245 (-) Transcript_7401:115-849(-)
MAGAPSSSADSLYVKDCRDAQQSTHGIQTLTGQISRLVAAGLANDDDFRKCRSMIEQAVSNASDVRTILLRIHEHQLQAQHPAERTNRRMMYQKLGDNLAITVRVLEDVMSRFNTELEKKRLQLGSARSSSSSSSGTGLAPQALLGENEDATQPAQGPFAISRVDEEMQQLKQIYTDLSAAAEEQQDPVGVLEEHIERSGGDLEQGSTPLDMGKYDLERQSRRKMWAAGGIAVFLMSTAVVMFS